MGKHHEKAGVMNPCPLGGTKPGSSVELGDGFWIQVALWDQPECHLFHS